MDGKITGKQLSAYGVNPAVLQLERAGGVFGGKLPCGKMFQYNISGRRLDGHILQPERFGKDVRRCGVKTKFLKSLRQFDQNGAVTVGDGNKT